MVRSFFRHPVGAALAVARAPKGLSVWTAPQHQKSVIPRE